MTQTRSLLLVSLFGVLGAIIYFTQYNDYSPLASFDLKFSRTDMIDKARTYLADLGYDASKLDADAKYQFDSGGALYLQLKYGLEEAHDILRADTLSTHTWRIYFYDRSLPPSQMLNQYVVWLTPGARIVGFTRTIPDSMSGEALTEAEARARAEAFLYEGGFDLERFELESSKADQHPNRRDYFFNWTRKDSVFEMTPEVWVRVQGNRIGGFRSDLTAPESFQQVSSQMQTLVTFIVTASSVATFVLLLFVITLFMKKYHEGEVGVRTAMGIFAFLFLLILAEHLLSFTVIGYGWSVGDVNRFNTRLIVFFMMVFIVQAFLAAMVFAGWSVGESSSRRGWGDKLKAIDGLLFRRPFTFEFASSTVRGYAFGFIILGIIYGASVLLSSQTNFAAFIAGTNGIPESYSPALSSALSAFRVALLNEIVFRFFFISWLREKTRRVWPGILISSLLWTLVAFTLWDFPLGYVSFTVLFPLYFFISVVLGLLVVRYDLLTAVFANFILLAFTYAIPMLAASGSFYETQTLFFFGVMAAPLGLAAVGFVKRQSFKLTWEIQPSHIRRITERERMSKELEIARNVQMSLLPKQNPLVEGYDIAGICIPALEVGGDYYDFFQLGDGKIGIAIGDVSGKGVPAAIYMTLTKGILQSYAVESGSPRQVLNKLNRQMYMNIERNSFVSMFYAVLDMAQAKIRFARAGHNPAILAHRSNDSNTLLQPRGIALGLESGERFESFLEEHEIPLESGDVLTFYTDGFTEASNKHGAEFGEDRLEQIISQSKNASANAIIQSVVRSVKKFVGNHPQHDDMTMVVIKVL